MAEIKSTLEKVMERLAAMDSTQAPDFDSEEKIKAGMRQGAAFLRGEEVDLVRFISEQPDSGLCRQGVVKALLRNIVLPRDEDMATTERAMQAVLTVAGGAGDLADVLREMKMVLDHYLTQRGQLRQQLETALHQQLQQALAQQMGGEPNTAMNIDPTQHPKFQEEWQRIKDGLNEQYGSAIEQHKELISQRLA